MSWWLIHNTLTAGLLAAAVVLICRWRAAHPALRHALWLVVLAKLIAPPLPVWSFAWPAAMTDWWRGEAIAKPADQAAMQPNNLTEAEPFATLDAESTPLREITAGTQPGDPESYEVLDAAALDDADRPAPQRAAMTPPMTTLAAPSAFDALESLSWRDLERYCWYAWLAGAAAMAGYQLVRWRRFQRLLDATRFAPDWLDDEVRGIAAELGIAAPQVVVMDVRCTPLVWVLGPARLLWPAAMLSGFSRDSRRTIIAHELAHLARRDHWVARLEALATPFWWWHPLFWYARAKLHDAAEQACDARVTQLLPGARKAYAQALIEVCELLAQAVTPGPALGIGSQTRRAFERRLTMIMREKVSSRLSLGAVLGIGILALAVLPGFTPAQDAPPQPEAPIAPSDPTGFAPPQPATAPAASSAPVAPVFDSAAVTLAVDPQPAPGFPKPPAATLDPLAAQPVAEPLTNAPATGLPADYPVPSMTPGAPMPMQAYPPAMMGGLPPGDPDGAEEVIHLTRATYRLQQPLADAFANFLNSTLSDSVQATVQIVQASPAPDAQDSSKIVVTADEETQRIVGHFIGLLKKHGKLHGPTAAMMSASMRYGEAMPYGQMMAPATTSIPVTDPYRPETPLAAPDADPARQPTPTDPQFDIPANSESPYGP